MSLYTDELVYVRVPKTGSSWVHDVLLGQCGARGFGAGAHVSLALLAEKFPDKVSGKTSFGMFRGPWDWYASWYFHIAQAAAKEATTEGFRKELRRATHSSEMKNHYDAPGIGVIWDLSDDLSTPSGEGLCSLAHNYVLGLDGDHSVDKAIPTDRLPEGLALLLEEPIQQQFSKPRNTRGNRKDPSLDRFSRYRDLYDDEMLEWVSAADRRFIERFQLKPFETSPFPIVEIS